MKTFISFACVIPILSAMTLLLVVIAGCGDGRPHCFPVSGQVLIDGKPLTRGFIRLIPKDARVATGVIDSNGHFTLKTFEDGDGVVPGTHLVTISAMEPISNKKQRWHAPKKYLDAKKSGLTATVDKSTDSLVIEISWNGGQPFVETVK